MGYNINILAEKNALSKRDVNHSARLELEECIHFHVDDFRFMWTTKEFLHLADIFAQAKEKVTEMGCPDQSDRMNVGLSWKAL
jgi:hypothetical protein